MLSGEHPIAFVSLGTHANVFHDGSAATDTEPPESDPTGEIVGYGVGGLFITVGAIIAGAGLAASPIGWVAVIVGATNICAGLMS